jgi:autotransporter-associated beta strand protein
MKRLAPALAASIAFCSGFVAHAGAAIVHSADLHPQPLGAAQNPFIAASRISATGNASAARAERAITDAAMVLASGGALKIGAGTLQINGSGAITYTGATLITNGSLRLTSGATIDLGVGSTTTDFAGATVAGVYEVNTFNSSAAFANLSAVTAGTLNLNPSELSLSTGLTIDSSFSAGLVKTGAGTLLLNGNSTFFGGTVVYSDLSFGASQTLQTLVISAEGTIILTGIPQNSAGRLSGLSSANGAAVPEPASGLLAALGAFAMAARRKRSR